MRHLFPGLLAFLAACGDDAAADRAALPPGTASRPTADEGPTVQMNQTYDGPELTAELETMESQPPQYAVNVKVQCMTGGYDLALSTTRRHGDATHVLLVLTEPGADEMVMQVLETRQLRVLLSEVSGPIQIGVQRVKRGAKDAAPPPFKLAKTLRKP